MMKWILIAIGIYLIFLITEEAITYYLQKSQQKITGTSDKMGTEKESL